MSYFCSMDKRSVRILVVDDEEAIREGLCEYLRLEGYRADSASGAEEAMRMGPGNYSLLLLDIMMEGIDGFELARRIRGDAATASLPIIFLTARDTDDDMVAGLRIGADDYIPKPFSMKNVMARIEAVLRRSGGAGASESGVVCDRTTLSCRVDGREIRLPRKEFEILALLLDNPGRIFTRQELMDRIWPENVVVTDRSVDVHITRLRSKIAPYGRNIVARSGYGYGWQ